MKKLCIYCVGGLGKEIFDIATRINIIDSRWDEIYFVDDNEGLAETAYSGRLFTMDKMLIEFDVDTIEVIIANGEPIIRAKLFKKVKKLKLNITSLIDPLASVSSSASIGEGLIAYPFSIIASDTFIGNNVLLNASAIIGHDIKIGNNTVISPHVCVGGATTIGDNSFIGMGSMIKEQLSIGSNVIVGMSSAVHKDVPDDVIAMGNPARPLRRNDDHKVFKK
jgi:sugar O-acyltransferase (sialic acid O-acetyltransferase NeuD family)